MGEGKQMPTGSSNREHPASRPRKEGSGRAGLIRPVVQALEAYKPGEQPQDKKYIKLNTNENPYPPSPRVLAALHDAANADLRLYPDPVANRLRDRAAEVYGVGRDQILVGNGSDELLTLIMRACVGANDAVVYPFPTYSLYDTLVTVQEGRPIHVPYGPDFSLPGGIAEHGGRVTFICHPNSPSGTAIPLDRLEDLAASVAGLLVVDEAYVDFADHSAMPLIDRFDNVLVLRTFSKSFSLAGMRVGLAFGPSALIEQIAKVKDSYNVNRLSIVAAAAALDDYEWMQANVGRIRSTRERLTAEMRRRGFDVLPSQANFLLARRPGEVLEDLYLRIRARGVLVRYFAVPELRDALRISIGTDEETDALLAALDAAQGRG
jgi:histidinol-phosphate aminotransferase